LTAENGRKWYWEEGVGEPGGPDDPALAEYQAKYVESANKLYVGMLIMLIFAEALALYGLIVALILSQHNYACA